MSIQELVAKLESPVNVIAGILGILASFVGVWRVIKTLRPKLRLWRAARRSHAQGKADRLWNRVSQDPGSLSDHRAISLLVQAEWLYRKQHDLYGQQVALIRMGKIRASLVSNARDDARALAAFERAAEVGSRAGNDASAAEAHESCAEMALRLRDNEKARGHVNQAASLYRLSGNELEAERLEQLFPLVEKQLGSNAPGT